MNVIFVKATRNCSYHPFDKGFPRARVALLVSRFIPFWNMNIEVRRINRTCHDLKRYSSFRPLFPPFTTSAPSTGSGDPFHDLLNM